MISSAQSNIFTASLARKRPKSRKRSMAQIAAELAAAGHLTGVGTAYAPMVRAAGRKQELIQIAANGKVGSPIQRARRSPTRSPRRHGRVSTAGSSAREPSRSSG